MAAFLLALVLISFAKFFGFKGGVYSATAVWATSLPIMATFGSSIILLANLTSSQRFAADSMALKPFFSTPELLILLILSAFYTTKLGQSLAALCTSLILLRIGFRPLNVFPGGLGVSLLLVCSVTIFVLGDYLPWLMPGKPNNRSGNVVRALTLGILCAASIGMTLLALFRLPEFCVWIEKIFGKIPSESLSTSLLCGVLVGWTLIALGQMRQALLFLMALPTLLLFSFIIGWTAPYLVAFLTLTTTLAIATQERRITQRLALT